MDFIMAFALQSEMRFLCICSCTCNILQKNSNICSWLIHLFVVFLPSYQEKHFNVSQDTPWDSNDCDCGICTNPYLSVASVGESLLVRHFCFSNPSNFSDIRCRVNFFVYACLCMSFLTHGYCIRYWIVCNHGDISKQMKNETDGSSLPLGSVVIASVLVRHMWKGSPCFIYL